jgi:hypothetical protein
MITWIKKKFRDWCVEAWHSERSDNVVSAKRSHHGLIDNDTIHGGMLDSEPTLQFTVYSAIGGKVVEFKTYDKNQDRRHHQVYVIGRDEDFGEKIAKIATLEALK